MRQRVVLTGLGCISPLGNDIASMWGNIINGQSGIGPITQFDASEHKTRIAAEVKGFDGAAHFGSREARRMDRFAQFAVASALQAVADARLEINDANRDRIGIVLGSGIGGLATLTDNILTLAERGPSRVSPFTIPMMLVDTGPGMIAIYPGVRGPNLAVVTACATGTNAIGEGAEIIRRGQADVILAGGSEAGILPITLAGFGVMNALSTRNDDPQGASRPFDLHRDGFVVGEGAAVVVLEALEFAQQRGAPILAEVVGYGASCDAYHVSAPAEDGAGAALCMNMALRQAGLQVDQIDYINAHGTSTALNDRSETNAVKTVFGEHAYHIPISSTKSMTGHLLGAAGAIEAAICVKAIQTGIIPPTINYEFPDPECDLDYVPNSIRQSDLRRVMSNSFGFGGHNTAIIFQRFENTVETLGTRGAS